MLATLLALSLVVAACGGDGGEETTTTAAGGSSGGLLDTVLDRGTLNCGVNEILVGFGFRTEDGDLVGFDVDLCRAVAAALFGDSEAVSYEPLTAAARFEALSSGQIDLLSRNTTHTQQRDAELALDFGPTTYYDGQQVMARTAEGFDSSAQITDLDGATVCTNAGTTTELNMQEAANAAGITITLTTYEDFNIVMENFVAGNCDAVTTDGSGLIGRKVQAGDAGDGWAIFPAVPISKEPLGPAWVQNNSRFGDVVNWVVWAQQIAEENGITSANVESLRSNPPNGEVGRLLGSEGDYAEMQTALGLSADAFYNVISQVGNYGEVFARHLTPLGLERGLNAPFADGGLHYPPPAR